MSVSIAQLWILFIAMGLMAMALDGVRSLYDKKLDLVDRAIMSGLSLGLYTYDLVIFILIIVNFSPSEHGFNW